MITFYTSFTKKYRPKDFKDVVGQNMIVKSLDQAIKNSKLSQSLLFYGPHGVGKTTCARIISNKLNYDGNDTKDVFNIFELDAASNNSVEDIKILIDSTKYKPHFGNYKIYIIDEVHMLSKSAFNAFLKILEEPPYYVIFILATTDKYKILPSVLSRCQIYDFKPISCNDISVKLHQIIKQESINVNSKTLFLIAKYSYGDLRRALFLLDKLFIYSDCNNFLLNENNVFDILGILNYSVYFKIIDLLIINKMSKVLIFFNKIINLGYSCDVFLNGFINHIRNILFVSNKETLILLEHVDKNDVELYINQYNKIGLEVLCTILDLCKETMYKYFKVVNAVFFIEIFLLKISDLFVINKKKKKYDNISVDEIIREFLSSNIINNILYFKVFLKCNIIFKKNKMIIYFNNVKILVDFCLFNNIFCSFIIKYLKNTKIKFYYFIKNKLNNLITIKDSDLIFLKKNRDILNIMIVELNLIL